MKNIMREIVKKYNGLPKKSVGIAGIGIVVIIILIAAYLSLQTPQPQLTILKETFVVELGDTISTDPKTYVTADSEILKETEIGIKLPKVDSIPVGTYTGIATYKDEQLKFTVEVKDTTAPEFVDFKNKIEVEQDSTEDLSTKFTATDLSDVTITVDVKK